VQQGDTLFAFQLGAENTVTVDELVAANCLDSRYLRVGQQIYLPPGAADNARHPTRRRLRGRADRAGRAYRTARARS
jgi:LysM repeat protein